MGSTASLIQHPHEYSSYSTKPQYVDHGGIMVVIQCTYYSIYLRSCIENIVFPIHCYTLLPTKVAQEYRHIWNGNSSRVYTVGSYVNLPRMSVETKLLTLVEQIQSMLYTPLLGLGGGDEAIYE